MPHLPDHRVPTTLWTLSRGQERRALFAKASPSFLDRVSSSLFREDLTNSMASVVRECKRGTTGPLLPPKANPRSQSSGCEPATACLQGRRSHARRLVYIGLRAGFIRYIWNVSEPGKRCHVFLPIIPAKCHLSGYLPSSQSRLLLTTG